jgi:hypothetical protein
MRMSGAYTGLGTDQASQYIRAIHPALAELVRASRRTSPQTAFS